MNNETSNFWSRVIELKNQKGISHQEFADALGITNGNWRSTISQNNTPTVFNAIKIAKVLNTSVEYLVTGQLKSTGLNLSEDALKIASIYDSLSDEAKQHLEATMTLLTK